MIENKTENHIKVNIPDDRGDHGNKIQRHISSTLQNIELADEMLAETSDPKVLKQLQDKNKKREGAT